MEEESAGGLACLGWEAIDAEMVRDGVESVLLAWLNDGAIHYIHTWDC
jgi:hypothetical protein